MFDEKDPKSCFEILASDPKTLLVDCRAKIEWDLTGIADLSSLGKKTLLVEWTDSQHQRNPDFVTQIKNYAAPDTPVIIMCRIGGRSADACKLLAEHGFTNLTNMTEGFEGRVDQNGHRNSIEGWRARGLPWYQS
ncbi:MAG: rhodanese-like domain-containing protein [Candidatus Puniceispirillaceae bacterium]